MVSLLYEISTILACFFFFQAEDGIRDKLVTGVQTCALPISRQPRAWHADSKPLNVRSHREGRSAAAAARGVGILEREPGLLEVALVVQRHAVQVLRAEPIHEAAHAGALDHDVVLERLLLDVQAVAEARASAREHADAESRRGGGNLLLRPQLAPFLGGPVRDGERDGRRP